MTASSTQTVLAADLDPLGVDTVRMFGDVCTRSRRQAAVIPAGRWHWPRPAEASDGEPEPILPATGSEVWLAPALLPHVAPGRPRRATPSTACTPGGSARRRRTRRRDPPAQIGEQWRVRTGNPGGR
jgi:hypothetical protein